MRVKCMHLQLRRSLVMVIHFVKMLSLAAEAHRMKIIMDEPDTPGNL